MNERKPEKRLKKWQRAAKHDFSMHQDNLFWSRTQTLIAVQGGTLAGAFAVKDYDALWLPLLVFGAVLTGLLLATAERDQNDRDLAFQQSRIPRVKQRSRQVGRILMRLVFGLMFAADFWLLLWIATFRGWLVWAGR